MKKQLIILFALAFTVSGFAQDASSGFERYRVIIQKAPFGEDEVDTIVMVQPPPAKNWAAEYRISMLREKAGGVVAGLVNKKTNRSVILNLNETDPVEGLKLLSADMEKMEISLQKGGETRSLSINPEDMAIKATARPATAKKSSGSKKSSFRARMEERRRMMAEAQKKKAPPKQPRLSGAALQKHLENYQVEAIKSGLPPLPVPITPAMEEQLVRDGALPAAPGGPPGP
jgi:hypothetical protein